MKRLSALPTMITAPLFTGEKAQLGGGDPGLSDLWNRLDDYIGQFPAVLPDDGHYTFFGYKEFVPGKNLQGVVKA